MENLSTLRLILVVVTMNLAYCCNALSLITENTSLILKTELRKPLEKKQDKQTRKLKSQSTDGSLTGVKIPIDAKRWYQLNNVSNGLDGLFDGDLYTSVNTGYGKVLANYDAYYPLKNDEDITIQSIRFFDGNGTFENTPLTLSVINDQWQRIPIATFTGISYNEWVGPDPSNRYNYNLTNLPAGRIRYLVINSYGDYPNEIEIYGSYSGGRASQSRKMANVSANSTATTTQRTVKMKDGFGVNGFEWDFFDPYNAIDIDPNKLKAFKPFSGFRHYMDWEKLENVEGSYSYNPCFNGGWNYDAIYEQCKNDGIEVVACLQTVPKWMTDTYPADLQNPNVVPVKYGKDIKDPHSYIEQARVGFQYVARYGSNPNVDPGLLSVYDKPRWYMDRVNTLKIGLGTIKYIECGNERDKWWVGRIGYQTAREYAANLSAFYDGHKNTMGPGAGVKNADPNIKVVMSGLALASPDYVRGMIDWCKEFRGYNPDGTVNLCWDVINYHHYSNNARSSQWGNPTRGNAPELSEAADVAKAFVQMAHNDAYDMPVWITEFGYDINQGSNQKAIAIGNKSEAITMADWGLRSSLMYNRYGIARSFFYEMYDDNVANPWRFASSGLINADKTRKPIADYLYQTNNLVGDYVYKETLSQDPIVDRYEKNGQSAYVLYIPDEVGRTGNYTLTIPGATGAKMYTPMAGRDTMDVATLSGGTGTFNVVVTETPVFVIPSGSVSSSYTTEPESGLGVFSTHSNPVIVTASVGTPDLTVKAVSNAFAPEKQIASVLSESPVGLDFLKTYPNPASDFLVVTFENNNNQDIDVKLMDTALGKVMLKNTYGKRENVFMEKIDIRNINTGSYLLEVLQGEERVVKKVVKIN